MAEFIEVLEDDSNVNNLEQQTEQDPTKDVDNSEPVAVVPDKYRGKSLEDIIRMHQESEKLIGRQAQEVGESRKLLDDVIKQQLNTTKQDTQPSATHNEIDYFEDPAKAVNYAVENNPLVKQLAEQAEMQRRGQALSQLQQAYPDFSEIVSSEDFTNWIKASKVRIDLFSKAHNYDLDAANELLENFTSLRGIKAKQSDDTLKEAGKGTREQALKSAAVQKGGTGEISKPIYRRVDLIRLRMTDPERYNAMQPDIMAAYAEGRVK
jgi:hypothetical protein